MKNKTKKTLIAWVVGIVFAATVGTVTHLLDVNVAITSLPTLVSACGWLCGKSLAVCAKLLGW